jgi:hypothetical protein
MASQVQKLNYVDGKLGAPTSGQQTTRIIFNTIENPGVATTLDFFKNFNGLTNGQTNLNQNKLDSMESMVIKSIWLAQIPSSGILATFGVAFAYTIDIIVGNQVVVKALPGMFNQGTTGQAFDRLHENAGVGTGAPNASAVQQAAMPTEIRLLTDIVIPPQVSFTVRINAAGQDFGNGAVVCALAGYGKIFSAGNSF